MKNVKCTFAFLLICLLPAGSAFGSTQAVVLNEVVGSTTSTDVEFIELYGPAGTSLDGLSVIVVESDDQASNGDIDKRIDFSGDDKIGDNGFFLVGGALVSTTYGVTPNLDLAGNFIENSSYTIALVETSTITGDSVSGSENVIDAVGVTDGETSDFFHFNAPVVGPSGSYLPAGFYRLSDGVDTDNASDFGMSSFYNDSDVNTPTSGTDENGGIGQVEEKFIHEIQGAGSSVTNEGSLVVIQGVVIGDYQGSNELKGFFIQEEDSDIDDDPDTSEGIFVYCGSSSDVDVEEGSIVRVTGTVDEYYDMSQINASASSAEIVIIDAGDNLGLVTPSVIELPASGATNEADTLEQYEGMLVQFANQLTVTEFYRLGRYGQLVLSQGGRQRQFTDGNSPDIQGYQDYVNDIAASRIILDDLNNDQNIDPVFHPRPDGFSKDFFVRGGDTVTNLKGVLHWSWAGYSGTEAWRVRPMKTEPVSFNRQSPRSYAPRDVGGNIRVASFNVLNYFTTIDTGNFICGPGGNMECRGADSQAELVRQTAKIVSALKEIDADILGLIELENNETQSLAALVNELNTGNPGLYAYINTGTIGTDAIKVGFIYKTGTVAPVGAFKILDSSVNSDFIDTKNRPALIQTFKETASNKVFTVAVNHFKSKGSSCDGIGDPNNSDGQGNCNSTRTKAAQALVDYLATDPTGSNDPDFLIIGDLNAYAMEDPVTAIEAAGYSNLVAEFNGSDAYSYVYDGQWGYLDHALATGNMSSQVTGVVQWHINADEAGLLDYNDTIVDASEDSYEAKPSTNELYESDAFRSSDHDPVIIGLTLTANKIPGDLDGDGDIDRSDINIIRQYRKQPVSSCPDCDIDGDGRITVLDARKLYKMCTCNRCSCSD